MGEVNGYIGGTFKTGSKLHWECGCTNIHPALTLMKVLSTKKVNASVLPAKKVHNKFLKIAEFSHFGGSHTLRAEHGIGLEDSLHSRRLLFSIIPIMGL